MDAVPEGVLFVLSGFDGVPLEFYAILGHMKSSNLSKPQINLDKECGLFGEKKCDHNLS